MADFGADWAYKNAEMQRARANDFFNRLYTQQQIGLERDKFDFEKTLPPKVPLEQQLLGAVQRVQAGQGTPQDIAILKAKAAMEGPKTQYTEDSLNPGRLIANTVPHPLEALLSGTQSTGAFAPEYGATAPSPAPVKREMLGDPGNTFDRFSQIGPQGQGTNPAIRNTYDMIVPQLQEDGSMAFNDTMPGVSDLPMSVAGSSLPVVSDRVNDSEWADMERLKGNVDMAKDANKIGMDVQKEIIVDKAKKQNEVATQRAEEKYQNDVSLPTMIDMLYYNLGTLQSPYAGSLQGVTRLTDPQKAQNMALLMQNRLDLAAPLAKQLGINPTDKDFQSTLERIFNENEDGKTRASLIQNLITKVERKNGPLPENYKNAMSLMSQAQEAIDQGADPAQVQARMRQMLSNGQ